MNLTVLLVLLIGGFFATDVVIAYRKAIGSVWQRLFSAVAVAASSVWTGLTVGASVLITALAQVADFVNAPGVASALQTYAKPSVVAAIFIASAMILEFVKRRSAK
jgi:hypothetical protein